MFEFLLLPEAVNSLAGHTWIPAQDNEARVASPRDILLAKTDIALQRLIAASRVIRAIEQELTEIRSDVVSLGL